MEPAGESDALTIGALLTVGLAGIVYGAVKVIGEMGTEDLLKWLHKKQRHGHNSAAEHTRSRSELRPDISDFVDRREEQKRLIKALKRATTARQPPGVPVLALITGPPYVGKTVLALHVAHKIGWRFPDGILCPGLRDGNGRPRPTREILIQLLDALGAPPAKLLDGSAEDCVRELSAELSGRRALILLDGAESTDQIKPLIPGVATCAVLVTAANTMTRLTPVELVSLEPLSEQDAVAIVQAQFPSRLGPLQKFMGHGAARSIINKIGTDPAVIRVTATRTKALKKGIEETARDLRARPVDQKRSLEQAYSDLDETTARLFRRLALLEQPEGFSRHVASSLLSPQDDAEEAFDRLIDSYMVEWLGADRCRWAEPIRRLASEHLAAEEPEQEQNAARLRVARYYCQLAGDWLASMLQDVAESSEGAESVHAADQRARAQLDGLIWFTQEWVALIAAVKWAVDGSDAHVACELASHMGQVAAITDRWDEWVPVAQSAISVALKSYDRSMGVVLQLVANAFQNRGELERAREVLTATLNTQFADGDYEGALVSLGILAGIYLREHQWRRAVDLCNVLLPWYERLLSYPRGLAGLRSILAEALLDGGQLDAAAAEGNEALKLYESQGDLSGQLRAHGILAKIYCEAGDLDSAELHLNDSANLARILQDHGNEARAFTQMGHIQWKRGDKSGASVLWKRAQDLHPKDPSLRAELTDLLQG